MTKKKNTTKTKNQGMQLVTANNPLSRGTVARRKGPTMSASLDGSMKISHTEYVSDISIGTTPLINSFIVNPQNPSCFTWLSAIASRFEYYKFEKFKIHYRPSCSTTVTGFVIAGLDFDFYDQVPNKRVMLSWKFAAKSPAYQQMTVDCTSGLPQTQWKFCESLYEQGDQRINNLGRIWVITDNSSTTANIGELFIEYTISFRQPSIKLPPPVFGEFLYGSPKWIANPSNTNIEVEQPIPNAFVIKTPGQYLIEVDSNATGGITAINGLFTADSGHPNTEFYFDVIKQIVDSGDAINVWEVNLISGAVRMVLELLVSGVYTGALRFTTFKSPRG